MHINNETTVETGGANPMITREEAIYLAEPVRQRNSKQESRYQTVNHRE